MDDAVSPSGAQWTISHGDQQAVVVEVGGGLRRWQVGGVDLLDGYGADEICPASAGQVLAPWPNRIRDGRYPFGDQTHQLALTEPDRHNALHGLVNWLPWQLVELADSSLTCQCVLPAQPGYPWTLRLRSTWSLSPAGLTGSHTAENLADSPAPFGFSIHPYLLLPGVAVSDLVLRVPAQTRLLTDSRLLPIGAAKVDGTEFDFTVPRRLGDLVLDTAYGSVLPDGDGGSAVTLAGPDGTGLRLWADQSFGWWQVYTSDTQPGERYRRSVAVEPMTCPPDAFRSGRDLMTLEPGQPWQASWQLSTYRG